VLGLLCNAQHFHVLRGPTRTQAPPAVPGICLVQTFTEEEILVLPVFASSSVKAALQQGRSYQVQDFCSLLPKNPE